MPRSSDRILAVLRVGVALLLLAHGAVRIKDAGVDGFGSFLGTKGVPFPLIVAWILTVMEVVGGVALAAGRMVRLLCLWFAVQLAVGIAWVHGPEGWFVVGPGRNGMEYNVLLILCLFVIAMTHTGRARRG